MDKKLTIQLPTMKIEKKMIENGRLALKRIDKIKEQNKMLIENARNNGSIYVRKKLDTKQRGKEKETVYSMIKKVKEISKTNDISLDLYRLKKTTIQKKH